ncbi:uroporphyrinogen-III C-methyltransferase [Psychrosphaera sp. F3M07]|uniref:uroporphyrinogen-III C-methyltransferase n=1 Tax=Psychrosphaera sp. F3M07 TaxID=2841560 RepID=UPI001C08D8B6|nr:uroporphyrinogen-III C-methyltransferase [Psychrosphaera sp. F3M07]MBU2918117.1 uroporphyrinogen-III C-methyltransferase [Psychrosphaera sp. F3M07]
MAQDKKSNPSKASNELTPPGEKEVADVNKAATKTDDDLSTLESLAKLESEIKQSRDAEKANQTAEVKKEEITQSKVKATAGKSSVENNKGQPSPDKTSSTNKDTAKTQTVKVKRQTSWLSIFAFIFSIAASAFVGFFWWQSQLWLKNQEQVDQLKQQAVINTQQSLNQLQAKLNQLQLVVEQKQNQTQNNSAKINDSLNSLAARIKELGQSQPNYWLAAEAGYLINLAERRLLVEQDVNTAIQLLLDANQRLTAMQDPSVFHIRAGISEDIASLYTVKQPDSDSIYLSISGLIKQTENIKFAQVYIPKPNTDIELQPEVSGEVDDWYNNLLTSLKRFFGNFITITQRDAEVQPQLPADQKWFVRANLTTQMLMAQNAILDKNQALYEDALKQVETWVMQYFDTDDAAVISFITTLNALKQKDIALSLPTGLQAQPLISNYLQQQIMLKESAND